MFKCLYRKCKNHELEIVKKQPKFSKTKWVPNKISLLVSLSTVSHQNGRYLDVLSHL